MLFPCKECGIEISLNAEVCPNCNFQQGAWHRKISRELKAKEEYESSEEYKAKKDKEARSRGFVNIEEQRIFERQEYERKKKEEKYKQFLKTLFFIVLFIGLVYYYMD